MDDIQGLAERMFGYAEEVKPPIGQRLNDFYIGVQEKGIDFAARVNRDTTAVARLWEKETGQKLPLEMQSQAWISTFPGTPYRAAALTKEALNKVQDILGNVHPDYLNVALRLRHSVDIEKMRGPQRLISGGVKGAQEAQRYLDKIVDELGPGEANRVVQAAEAVRDLYARMLQEGVDEGTVPAALARKLREQYPWYNPIRYLEAAFDEAGAGVGGRTFSVGRNDIRRLGEYGLEVQSQAPLELIPRAIMRHELLLTRNQTARSIIKMELQNPAMAASFRRVRTPREGRELPGQAAMFRGPVEKPEHTLSYMENGRKVTYEVPESIERIARQMELVGLEGWVRAGYWINALPRQFITGGNPAFMTANMMIDSMTVAVTKGVMPWSTAAALAKNLRAIVKEDPGYNRFVKAGAHVGGFAGKSPRQMIAEVEKSGNLAIYDRNSWEKVFKHPLESMMRLGSAIELAPRRAVFETELRKGTPELMAAMEARRATVDFQRMGTAMRLANAFYIYLNASVQGGLIPLRALRDSRVARYGVMGYLGVTAAAYQWNRQFPEYFDIPIQDRASRFLIMFPSEEYNRQGQKVPHFFNLVPAVREFAAFSSPMTYFFGRMEQREPAAMEEWLGAMGRALNPFSSIIETGGGLQPPTYLAQLVNEIIKNKNEYFDRPIVPPELEALPADQQYDERSSETSIRVGRFLHLSPKYIDHIIRTGVGQDIVAGVDVLLRRNLPRERNPRAEMMAEHLQSINDYLPPDQIAGARRLYLNSLKAADREAVLREERRPEPSLPMVSSIQRRFWRTRGGQLYQSGLERGAEQLNLSATQTRRISSNLRRVGEELTAAQQQVDDALIAQTINGKRWREERDRLGKLWQGALLGLATEYPQAASVADPKDRAKFWDMVATVGGAMPDRRSQAELLYSAWLSITPNEIAPGVPDMEQFFRDRDAYLERLTPAQRNLLQVERQSRMTPVERQFDNFQTMVRPYWRMQDLYFQQHPATKRAFENLEKAKLLRQPHIEEAIERSEELRQMHRTVAQWKLQWRTAHPTGDALLRLWGYTDTNRTPQADLTYRSVALGQEYRLPEAQTPALAAP